MPISSREVLQKLKKDGWYIVAQEGSHIQLKHPTKPGKVTVKEGVKDIRIKTQKSIQKQSGLKF